MEAAEIVTIEGPTTEMEPTPEEEVSGEFTFACPECNSMITADATECSNCGAVFESEEEDFAEEGYEGLQNHDSRSPIYFRNIFIKELK